MTAREADITSPRLPHPVTPLLGREHEVAVGRDLLRGSGARLVTLTGPGGVGKTRLAIELAHVVAGDFADGVQFVSLAPVTEPGLVASVIASALGIRVTAGSAVADALLEELPQRDMLLILDNFEQVQAAAYLPAVLLSRGSRLRLLVTSRSLLRLSGEHHLPVAPLAVSDLAHPPPLHDLAKVASVQLFVERARAATGNFTLTEENSAAVATVCAGLDGLPLAIELAAARMRHLALPVIVDRLGQRLDLLVGGPGDQPPRLQTMRAAISWGYDHLAPREQRLMRHLAVFAGGWTLEAAAAVAGEAHDPPDAMLERISALIDLSLVKPGSSDNGEPRFTMLETIREFAMEHLRQQGERDAALHGHLRYYLDLAQRARERLSGPDQAAWLARLDADLENLRAAFAWAFEAGEIDAVLRLGGSLWGFWATRGHLLEGRGYLARGLAIEGQVDAAVRADASYCLGNLALDLIDYPEARSRFAETLEIWGSLDDQDGVASALNGLGLVARDMGEYARARAHFEEALGIWTALDDRAGVAIAHHNLATVATAEGAYKRAEDHNLAALQQRRALGELDGEAYSLWSQATIATLTGDQATAMARFSESLHLFRELGDLQGETYVLRGMANLAQRAGDDSEALSRFRDALLLLQALGEPNGLVECLDGIGAVAGKRGQFEAATRLLAAATARRSATEAVPSAADRRMQKQTLDAARKSLGEKAFAATWQAGQSLSLDQAVAEAFVWSENAAGVSRAAAPFNLSPRELEVLVLLSQHLTDKEIAERLFLSPRTVERHVGAILAKLDVPNRRFAAALANERNLG